MTETGMDELSTDLDVILYNAVVGRFSEKVAKTIFKESLKEITKYRVSNTTGQNHFSHF